MLVENLFEQALILPTHNSNKLFVVSGYATATFARRHILALKEKKKEIEINLIIGMPSAKSDHLAFLSLHDEFPNSFKGYYLQNSPPVHSKAYAWFNDDHPSQGFAGSANYSQFGFFSEKQINQLSTEDPFKIKMLYDSVESRAIYMPNLEVTLPVGHSIIGPTNSVLPGSVLWEIPDKRVRISLLDKAGKLPGLSGLNWGQRREKRIDKKTGNITFGTREPNQAYLSLKGDARREGFLPERGFNFSLITDDGHSFDCVVAQDGRKAIHSTVNNSYLGKYFRNRLNLPLGEFIEEKNLEDYGRTDYTIEKIDDETFLLDFSVE